MSTETLTAHDGLEIPLNVYLPADRPPGKRLPVIVSFHGGPAGVSSLSWSPYREKQIELMARAARFLEDVLRRAGPRGPVSSGGLTSRGPGRRTGACAHPA